VRSNPSAAWILVIWKTKKSDQVFFFLHRRQGDQASMLWSQFSAKKKLEFCSKTNVMIKILDNLALFWDKNANFFAEIFGKNIF
jgi:UDP-glucose 4-epimerase